jgi:serine/threonine protein kinase
MNPARTFSSQREVGKYHLVAELARGGMGNVYLATTHGPAGFHKVVVLKELKPEFCQDEAYVTMFLDEARLAARLTHPNIVQTNEVGSEGGRHYMVMEFLDGRSLYRLVRHFANGSSLFPIGAHLRVIAEALLGLDYAHELHGFDGAPMGIVHRDVSPLNVVVTFDGQTKILDFGIAKAVDSSFETSAGILKGRVAYMAPEQARGARVDRRADIYAAGVMIWEAAARRRLWPEMSEVEVLTHVLGRGAPSLRSVVPAAPAALDAICDRAMAGNPADRYPTAAALFQDLDAHIARRGDAMTMRAIGSLLSQTFKEERQKTSQAIEETLLRVQGGSRSGVMPVFQNPISDGRSSESDNLVVDMGSLSSIPVLASGHANSGFAPAGQRSSGGTAATAMMQRAQALPIVVFAATALAATFVAGAFVATSHRAESKAPSTSAASAFPTSAPPVQSAAPDRPVQLAPPSGDPSIHVEDLARSAYLPKVQREEPMPTHRLVAPPLKYVASDPVRRSTSAAPATQAVLPAGPTDVDPAGGRAPLRPIVTSNPYGAP